MTRSPRSLRLLAWPDYTLGEVHRRFEAKTGIAIEFENFDQNEDAFLRVTRDPDRFDVVFADGYWPAEYLAAGLVSPIPLDDVAGSAALHPAFRDFCERGPWRGEGGSAAYPANFGRRGIVWNRELVDPPISRWRDLWRPGLAGGLWVNSQGSELVAEVAIGLGLPPDDAYSLDPRELDQVGMRMVELGRMAGGIWMVLPDLLHAFGQAGALVAEVHTTYLAGNLRAELGIDFAVTVPQEGTVAWVDGAMVTRASGAREEALAFIAYLFSEEGVLLQWEHSDGYAPTSAAALAALREDGRWAEKIEEIAAEDPATVLGATLYRPPGDVDAYLGAWRRLLQEVGERAPAEAWDGVRAIGARP
jgi:spermidine/putrescine-binding protein